MTKQRKFQRGSSTYKCTSCGKLTRNIEGEESCNLCLKCYEIAGCENGLSDAGHPSPWGFFDECETVEDVRQLYQVEYDKLVANK